MRAKLCHSMRLWLTVDTVIRIKSVAKRYQYTCAWQADKTLDPLPALQTANRGGLMTFHFTRGTLSGKNEKALKSLDGDTMRRHHEGLRNNHRTALNSTSAEGDDWFLDQRKSPICSLSETRNGWQIEGHPFDLISRSFALPVNTCMEWERDFQCASVTVGVTATASWSSFQVFDKFRINLCSCRLK